MDGSISNEKRHILSLYIENGAGENETEGFHR